MSQRVARYINISASIFLLTFPIWLTVFNQFGTSADFDYPIDRKDRIACYFFNDAYLCNGDYSLMSHIDNNRKYYVYKSISFYFNFKCTIILIFPIAFIFLANYFYKNIPIHNIYKNNGKAPSDGYRDFFIFLTFIPIFYIYLIYYPRIDNVFIYNSEKSIRYKIRFSDDFWTWILYFYKSTIPDIMAGFLIVSAFAAFMRARSVKAAS